MIGNNRGRRTLVRFSRRLEKGGDGRAAVSGQRVVGENVRSDQTEDPCIGKYGEVKPQNPPQGVVVVQFADPDQAVFLCEGIPTGEGVWGRATEKKGGKGIAQDRAQIPGEAVLPVGHEIPDAETRVAGHRPVRPGVMFHVKQRGPFMIRVGDKSHSPLVPHAVDVGLWRHVRKVLRVCNRFSMLKGQIMVEARGDLLADDEPCAVMPSLKSVFSCLECGMVRE